MAELTLKSTDLGVIQRRYWRVPGSYGYGPEFATQADAVEAAKASIRLIEGVEAERFTRAWVEERMLIRWLPAAGEIGAAVDRSVGREEIILTEAEKQLRRVRVARGVV